MKNVDRYRSYDPSPRWMQAGWVTWLILVTCVATALATWFGSNSLTNWLRWSSEDIVAGQWWRAITPVFLHFNVFNAIFIHVLFNWRSY